MSPTPPEAVAGYHAHIYYDPATTRDRAAALRAEVAERFPAARLGRMHDVPVGPHPAAMFQIAFPVGLFAALVPWLMLNRRGLTVLVHPETDDPRADHLERALWMGAVLPLDASVLPERRAPAARP
ncbi:DOPA 4,5-dioxygenase family protein [Caldovatus aquaticus]|uniref:DOPA 4,5-dioxygenase family protein n=1 Tax=Caldovatus aquaticus TaxID=2865671 RepID=A0ABS7F576_9PROT|nr:DOPA 4,5-dioxygenase family protein [Caldovatus aquaticus]MBW8270782.1 DOPA 4,5-dioxygenase family protein [Caldovatus aquaticus]